MHLMAVCDCCGGVKVFKVHITVAMAKKQISDKVNILSPKLSAYLYNKCLAVMSVMSVAWKQVDNKNSIILL